MVIGSPVAGEPFEPFRLNFTATTADVVMRRLADWVGVRWISEDAALSRAVLSTDMEVATWDDVYALVTWLAQSTGSSVKWRGKTAVFSRLKEGAASPADGYLIRSAPIPEQLAAIAKERFGVSCSPYGSMSVCLGPVLDIEDARRFFSALEGAYGRVLWRVLETQSPVDAMVEALGVEQHVIASKVGERRWLIASPDERLLTLVLEAVNAADGPECSVESYRPQYLAVDDLVLLLSSSLVQLCEKPVSVNGTVYWASAQRQTSRARAILLHADRPDETARLLVVVAQEVEARRLGVLGDFSVGSTTNAANVQLLASLAKASGWRTLEVTTAGKATAGVTQTDRIQGDVIVTDGGTQIAERIERTVGLTVSVDGNVTEAGFRGEIKLNDSVLDGETQRGANCTGAVLVTFGSLARVCSYQRFDRTWAASITDGAETQRNRQNFVVVAALLAHEQAPIDTLRIVLQGKR